jgi:hypothetical protein
MKHAKRLPFFLKKMPGSLVQAVTPADGKVVTMDTLQ